MASKYLVTRKKIDVAQYVMSQILASCFHGLRMSTESTDLFVRSALNIHVGYVSEGSVNGKFKIR